MRAREREREVRRITNTAHGISESDSAAHATARGQVPDQVVEVPPSALTGGGATRGSGGEGVARERSGGTEGQGDGREVLPWSKGSREEGRRRLHSRWRG